MKQFKNPMSFAGLAQYLGVPRQRIYNLSKRYKFLAPVIINGKRVFTPYQVGIIIDSVIHVRTRTGTQLRFNFI